MALKNRLRNILRIFLSNYYQWRSWKHIEKSMKNYEKDLKTDNQKSQKPGIAFSFDDSFRVEHWYEYGKDILGYYDVKATFNINAFHHFENQREHSQKEIDMLLELQSEGHEIAHHGFKHRRSTHYSKEHGMSKWIEDDIKPLFEWMEKQSHSKTHEKFKKPVTYAFPHFKYEERHIKEISPKYFKVLRGHYHADKLTPFNHTGFAPSICIDSCVLMKGRSIKRIMKIAKKAGRNLILTCHSILPEEASWEAFKWGKVAGDAGKWRISPETLQMIISEARKMDLAFYTTSEIAGVATFIDRNFEMCVREQLQNPFIQWIPIEELCLIKSLDISNQNISNLDGIQYLSNLETLNLSNNNVTDLRLLERLPNLNKVDISNNPIGKTKVNNNLVSLVF